MTEKNAASKAEISGTVQTDCGEGRKHLPVMGMGPLYVGVVVALTVAALLLSRSGTLPLLRLDALRWPLLIIGILLMAGGIWMILAANFQCRISANIEQNRLVTGGVYARVRHPIYSAFIFLGSGALLLANNLYLLLLPPLFWLFLTLLMKHTEEKWLLQLYGQQYADYCRRVPRCIPRLRVDKKG